MKLNKIKLEYNGNKYAYSYVTGHWSENGYLTFPDDVPNEVREMREKMADVVSNA